MENTINSFDVIFWGERALFSNPLTVLTGSKYSYSTPPVSAVKGMLKSIYWKPSVEWVVDSIEVLNEIQRENVNVLLCADNYRKSQRGTNSYLKDVAYRVKAHLVPSVWKKQFAQDQQHNLVKHVKIAHERFRRGSGYATPVLGVSECRAFVREACAEDGGGYYENRDVLLDMGLLDLVYPVRKGDSLYRIFWTPVMKKGVIDIPDIDDIVDKYKKGELVEGFIVDEVQGNEYMIYFPKWTESEEAVVKDV